MRPNRPHIPSFFHLVKERSKDKNDQGASFLAYPRPPCLQIFRTSASFLLSLFRRFRPSPSRFRFGEGVFTEVRREPQEEKMRFHRFFSFFRIYPQNLGVGAIFGTIGAALRQFSVAGQAVRRPARGVWTGCARVAPQAGQGRRRGRGAVRWAMPSPTPHSESPLLGPRHR